jgi:hypothetical protein
MPKYSPKGAAQIAFLRVCALADALRARYGEAVVAILVYGFCFRRHTEELVDL